MELSTSGSTDRSLLGRLRQGEPDAWTNFVQLYGPLLFYWARRHHLSEPDAAEVTQETLLKVSQSIAKFELERGNGSLRGWLLTIVRNAVRDHYRRHERVQGVGGTSMHNIMLSVPEQVSADDADECDEYSALLYRALEQVRAEFEPRTWEAFWRTAVDKHNTADVAAELGLTPNNVRQAKSRVLRRLREQLQGWDL